MAVSANRLELLQIADAVAREKAIDKQIVLAAMEDAIQKAARSRYGQETDIRAEIDRKTGEMRLRGTSSWSRTRSRTIRRRSPLAEARKRHNPAAQVGDFIAETLPPIDFGRIAAQSAKQVIVQKVREAERDRQYDEYKDRIGEIVNGSVKRVEYGNVIVDLGRGEAIMRRDELIPRENFRPGDRVRAYVYDVRREARGPQIFLSRTHPQFMAKLFAQEVPEIYDGIIEIKAVARDPGSRAKIAVISRDTSHRSGRRLRRHARLARAGGRRRAAGREDRHHPVVAGPGDLHRQRAAAGRSRQGRARRGGRPHRGRGARRPALAGDRPPRPERAPRLAAHRLGHRHPDRGRGIGAPPEGIRRAHRAVHGGARRRRGGRPAAGLRRLPHGRGSRLRRLRRAGRDRGLRRGHRRRDPDAARRTTSPGSRPSTTARRRNSASPTSCKEIDGVTTAMLVALGENGVKTVEDLAGCATDDLVGWTERKGAEAIRTRASSTASSISREEAEAMIMAARVKAGWIESRRSGRGRPRREAEAARPKASCERIVRTIVAERASEPRRGRRARSATCIVARAQA